MNIIILINRVSTFLIAKFADDYFKILCPSSSPITKYYGVDELCSIREYPIKIDGNFTHTLIGDVMMSRVQNLIEFYNSTFIPNNYIDIPQVFFVATETNISYVIGMVICIFGIVLFVLMVIECFIAIFIC